MKFNLFLFLLIVLFAIVILADDDKPKLADTYKSCAKGICEQCGVVVDAVFVHPPNNWKALSCYFFSCICKINLALKHHMKLPLFWLNGRFFVLKYSFSL
ncbi:hypothetical protein RCL_jg11176.t1 [Rhizophagus clarus]|uniref:Uncharacterized protein n=1 Tax=Rhizophagus clarus TaxID=94130 RepID=A0A8H3R354_9GLOM|nr:hypothetical protein RCL_jg11176.t1 [Rhizophagus clarus]